MALNDIVRSFAGVLFPIGLGFLWTWQNATAVVLAITLLPVVGTISYTILYLKLSWLQRTAALAMETEPQ